MNVNYGKFLSKLTGIPIPELDYWHSTAVIALYKSPTHDVNDLKTLIAVMRKLYLSSKRRSLMSNYK
jgi:hypothetical protein